MLCSSDNVCGRSASISVVVVVFVFVVFVVVVVVDDFFVDCSANVVVVLEAFDCTLNRPNWRITSYAAPAEKYVLAGVNSKLTPLHPSRRTHVGLAISLAM